jgi:CubicO group peptidase (beta-lactamase class C family)
MSASDMEPSELQHLLTEVVRLGAAPGAAVALSLGGARTFAAAGSAISTAHVPLLPDSRAQLGCIAKLLTAMVALELCADGRFDLDAPIETCLPELRETSLGQSVRIRHLLTHTSGYRGPNVADPSIRYYYTWDKLVELLRNGTRLFEPGTFFNYEHTESVLLGEIVGRIANTDVLELHRRVILAPLGIQMPHGDLPNAQHEIPEHSFDQATQRFVPMRRAPRCPFWRASLSDETLSLEELLRLAEAAAGLDPARVLRPRTVALLREPHVRLPTCIGGSLREDIPYSFGFGCAQYGAGVFGHNGSARGQTCSLRYDARSSLVVVVALNAWRPHIRDMLCRKIVAAATGEGTPAAAEILPDWEFGDVTGNYAGAVGASAEVAEHGGHLVCTLRASSARNALRLIVTRKADGSLELASEAPQLTLGFSRINPSRSPLMMAGLNAYRRIE